MTKQLLVGVLAFLAIAAPVVVQADDICHPISELTNSYRIYLPMVAQSKLSDLKVVDQRAEINGPRQSSIYRKTNEYPAPVPVIAVKDAQTGVTITVTNFGNADGENKPFLDIEIFKHFVLYRAAELDSSGNPIGEVSRCGYFYDSTFNYKGLADGSHAYFAVTSESVNGIESGYSNWALGVALRETGVADDFAIYGGSEQNTNDDDLSWLQIATFESDEGWSGTSATLSYVSGVEGDSALSVAVSGATIAYAALSKTLDLDAEGRFTDDDYVTFNIYGASTTTVGSIYLQFVAGASGSYSLLASSGTSLYGGGTLTTDWSQIKAKKTAFSKSAGTFTWADITEVRLYFTHGTGTYATIYFDDLRLTKASVLDADTYSDTGDKWRPYADGNLGDSADLSQVHVQTDMPGFDYALGAYGGTTGIIEGPSDRPQDSATHLVAQQIRDADGQAGMIIRSHQQPVGLTAETPELNVMFTNSSAEAVGQTHTAAASYVTYAEDVNLGSYASFAGIYGDAHYSSVALVNSRNEATIHLAIKTGYAYGDTSATRTLLTHYIDSNNNLYLYYNGASDKWVLAVTSNGSYITLESDAQTFSADATFAFDVIIDDLAIDFYVNGIVVDTDTLSYNYDSGTGTLYIANNNSGTALSVGKYYQFIVNHEAATASDVLNWYNGFLVGYKVASPEQRNYYAYEVDTSANQLTLTKHRIGWEIDSLSTALSYSAAYDTVYHLAISAQNEDADNDGDADQVRLKCYISTSETDILTGNRQVFSVVDDTNPYYSGLVGLRVESGANARWGNYRAGSPDHALTAEYANVAGVAKDVAPDADLSINSLTATEGVTADTLHVGDGAAITGATAQIDGALVIGDGAGGKRMSLNDGKITLTRDTQTISGGTISYTASWMRIDTEGSASTDDLTTINNGELGDLLILQSVTGTRDVTIKHFSDNIICQKTGGDIVLGSSNDATILIYNGSYWVELA